MTKQFYSYKKKNKKHNMSNMILGHKLVTLPYDD